MYDNAKRPGKYAKRPSRRRRKTYRLLYAVNFLLLIAAAVQAFSNFREQRHGSEFLPEANASVQETVPATETLGYAAPVTLPAPADEIDEAADKVLTKILADDMTPLQQAVAIYDWARQNLRYGSHTTRESYRAAAMEMLTTYRGDCYGYFAVTKLLMERLGIPNIDVVKQVSSPEDNEHFWSLVSVDGGETYYHFDATPRLGGGDNFCLVTDAYLDAYSEKHDHSHARDTSLYPATPEE